MACIFLLLSTQVDIFRKAFNIFGLHIFSLSAQVDIFVKHELYYAHEACHIYTSRYFHKVFNSIPFRYSIPSTQVDIFIKYSTGDREFNPNQ